jgi:hypothetical protein
MFFLNTIYYNYVCSTLVRHKVINRNLVRTFFFCFTKTGTITLLYDILVLVEISGRASMKKKFIIVLAVILITTSLMFGCKSKEGLTEITLNEVAHSIFYAPMYVAFEKDYFKEEGLKVNLVNGLGADKTMTAV